MPDGVGTGPCGGASFAPLPAGREGGLLRHRDRVVDHTAAANVSAPTRWWLDLTDAGGGGMVVKPLDVIAKGRRFFVQPALKVRGREYLRIIYGPDYLAPEHAVRLKHRAVGAKPPGLAARASSASVSKDWSGSPRAAPLREIHECVFAVLAASKANRSSTRGL